MNDLKSRQRRKAYDVRNEQIDKDVMSRIICAQFVAHPIYQQAKTVMWYIHCRSEVRTQSALLGELDAGKRMVIPYCTKDEQGHNKLGLWWLEDFAELVSGMWGILEPPKQRWGELGKEVAPEQLDCVMVPGVAFDRNGGRLGNGAGYYDRLLKSVRADAELIGVCFESQLVEQVAMDAHDVAMDIVMTEKTLYAGKGRQFSN
ncbi:5-formyltetrahydrofolate cyclo-ligase [Methylobacter tundripaludum]|uniref:5-formyltetrahydrofolate cyclo-ligase n=1 Tax=Methylobacter tundripaludum (strain ATCC BAA-1195 / DSM 17260 / SV96) TaxID=697282 RepID=G3IYH5_METTV|nr:5-formyltetrahydrofolate cyclo-ligase [Methylobacter tundripaludum]EGW21197.1 5-formyltetrahydrofolate cyclo-ligase [Methylobacter tundripaludum SV96]